MNNLPAPMHNPCPPLDDEDRAADAKAELEALAAEINAYLVGDDRHVTADDNGHLAMCTEADGGIVGWVDPEAAEAEFAYAKERRRNSDQLWSALESVAC